MHDAVRDIEVGHGARGGLHTGGFGAIQHMLQIALRLFGRGFFIVLVGDRIGGRHAIEPDGRGERLGHGRATISAPTERAKQTPAFAAWADSGDPSVGIRIFLNMSGSLHGCVWSPSHRKRGIRRQSSYPDGPAIPASAPAGEPDLETGGGRDPARYSPLPRQPSFVASIAATQRTNGCSGCRCGSRPGRAAAAFPAVG